MSTQAQITVNQANAQLSTGPSSEEGKAISALNRITHGLCYDGTHFFLLPSENPHAYNLLVIDLVKEHNPKGHTENILVERIAQHHWLRNRAEAMETRCFSEDGSVDEKRLALYMRYRTSHERAFHKCLNDLLKLRAEKRKHEIGFESQKQQTALNEARTRLANARASNVEIDSEVRQTCEVTMPGHLPVPFDDLCDAFRITLRELNENWKAKLAA